MGIEILKEQTCDFCDEIHDCAEIETESCGVYWICENCLKKALDAFDRPSGITER